MYLIQQIFFGSNLAFIQITFCLIFRYSVMLKTQGGLPVVIYRVFQKFVPIANCILHKLLMLLYIGKFQLLQVRNLSK